MHFHMRSGSITVTVFRVASSGLTDSKIWEFNQTTVFDSPSKTFLCWGHFERPQLLFDRS